MSTYRPCAGCDEPCGCPLTRPVSCSTCFDTGRAIEFTGVDRHAAFVPCPKNCQPPVSGSR